MYACRFGLSNKDVRMSLRKVSQPVTMWRELISREINYAAMAAITGCPHAPVAMTQQ